MIRPQREGSRLHSFTISFAFTDFYGFTEIYRWSRRRWRGIQMAEVKAQEQLEGVRPCQLFHCAARRVARRA